MRKYIYNYVQSYPIRLATKCLFNLRLHSVLVKVLVANFRYSILHSTRLVVDSQVTFHFTIEQHRKNQMHSNAL